jgi:hypothetical protein
MNIEMWKKAVVHIEGAADSAVAQARRDSIWEASRAIEDPGKWHELMSQMPAGRDVRTHGTAVFIRRNGKRFLVTARHVLHGTPDMEEIRGRQPGSEREDSFIFPIIFRVPTLDEALAAGPPNDIVQEFLMNLSAGVPSMTPYTYSKPEIDLAIISLDQPSLKRTLDQKCSEISSSHHLIIHAVTTPPLVDVGNRAERAARWTSERPRAVELIADLAAVAALSDDEELESETMKLWELWKRLVNSADTLCWSDSNIDITKASQVYGDSVARITQQFLRFTAAWIFPGDWTSMDGIPADWTPIDLDSQTRDES